MKGLVVPCLATARMPHDGCQRDSPAERPQRGLARSHAVVLLTVLLQSTLWRSSAGQDAVRKVRFAPPTLAQRTRVVLHDDPAPVGWVRVLRQPCLGVAR